MKKLLLVLFAGLLSLLSNELKAQDVFQPYKTNAVPYHGYLYPVIPGTEEWIALGSYEARLASVQLPIDTLKSISTNRLLETCIYNPFMIDAWVLDDVMYSMQLLTNRLNCLEEFYGREDALYELVSLYSSRQVEFVFEIPEGEGSAYDHGKYHMDYAYMELMMAYMNTIIEFSSSEIKEVISALLDKTTRWELYYDEYGASSKQDVLLLMGRLLNKEGAFYDYQGTTLYTFLEYGYCPDPNDLDYIMLVARRYTDVEENSFDYRVTAFPNPTDRLVKIIGTEVECVEVFNALGQLIKESKENVIDLSAQETGTYILKVITPSGVVTKQIVKN